MITEPATESVTVPAEAISKSMNKSSTSLLHFCTRPLIKAHTFHENGQVQSTCDVVSGSCRQILHVASIQTFLRHRLFLVGLNVSPNPRSIAADSIEVRQALHQYFKLFHKNHVEHAHKDGTLDELGEQCHTPYVPSIQIQSVHNQFPPLEGIIKCSLKDDASLEKLNARFNNNNNSNNKVLVTKFVVKQLIHFTSTTTNWYPIRTLFVNPCGPTWGTEMSNTRAM